MHVPYKGGAPATTATLAGDTQVMFSGTSVSPQVKAGKLRAIASSGAKRSEAFPDVPAIGEFYPGYDATIWLGRRLAYLGRYRDAIETYSEGIEKHPDDARMYRHRGHRYITVRELAKAIADFDKAAALVAGKPDQVEPDGQPNARNIPTSTLQSNIYYHLGLAHYLTGDFAKASDAYLKCLAVSKNPDMLVATTYWAYLARARQGRARDAAALLAPITAGMDVIENASYHRLLRMFRGELTVESLLPQGAAGLDTVTTKYGVAAWHLANGRKDAALVLLREIVDGVPQQWPAFGYVAAEADLARLTRNGG